MSNRAKDAALKAYPPKRKEVSMTGAIYTVVGGDFERRIFKEGYEQAEKDLGWHSVDESLPPVDEEVIVLTDELNTAPIYKIALGHIVDRMHCSDYNGWNIPGVKYWMPMPKLPNEEEK